MREKEFLPLVSSALGIAELNEMQLQMLRSSAEAGRGILLLAPTGSGKTLAFTLPLLRLLNPPAGRVQAIVIAPGRELVQQISSVIRVLAPAYRLVSLYGGHSVTDEVNSLSVAPDIIVATPGRLLDHIRRRNVDVITCRIAVLDEYDKSLSLGFEDEMRHIFSHLKNLSRVILTSATEAASVPDFLPITDPLRIDYLGDMEELKERMPVHIVRSDERDKLQSLHELLLYLAGKEEGLGRTVIFVNYRESAERVNSGLKKWGVDSEVYHGALDQTAREKAIALFRAGSRPVLVTTDLGARGLDIEGVDNVIHYHIPPTPEDWTHRNGRTSRAGRCGNVYLILSPGEEIPPYVEDYDTVELPKDLADNSELLKSRYATLWIGAGKRDKLSKGDLLGWLTKQCGLPGAEIGRIEIADHYGLVTLPKSSARKILAAGKNHKIKGTSRRVTIA